MNTTTKTDTPTQKESLFNIGESFFALESLLFETEGEITEEIDQWLAEYQAKEEEKIDAYCYIIQKFEEIAEEAKRLADRSSGYRNKVSQLKDRLKTYLEVRGRDKIETPRFTVTICGNGGLLPVKLNEGIDSTKLPDQFVRVHKEADMSSLRDALLNGDEEIGRFATILPRGTHLRIK